MCDATEDVGAGNAMHRIRNANMKAWQCSGYGKKLTLATDLPVPAPGIGEVLVSIHYAALDPLDVNLLAGTYEDRFQIDTFPFVPGFDVAGQVVALGPECLRLSVGDRVALCLGVKESCSKGTTFGPAGALAEYCVCPEEQVSKVPDTLLLSAVAGLPLAGLTAYQALFTGKGASSTGGSLGDVKEGSNVLVLGGDRGTGHLAVQMAKHKGANVVTTAPLEKVHWLERIGASQVLDYKKEDWLVNLKGREFDIILDCVGWAATPDEVDSASQLLCAGGLFVGTSNFSAMEAAGSKGGCQFKALVPRADSEDLDVLIDWLASGRLEVMNDKVWPFSEAGEVIQTNIARCGKAIICQCAASVAVPCQHAAGGGA
eukprot:TRINITY_DN4414_c0_g1_i3.p1 TRINITY_DN4414_c0_g1~~TRINITY_DN4414_c0_g1_i3.p1  ORF type:complete len:372 (+),score=69.67 TRINITY_DN4414_c0_g1_i3:191-1306(+)